jgi:hypothetical protein
LLIFTVSLAIIWRKKQSDAASNADIFAIGLAEFTLLTLVPFAIALSVAPFDTQGKFLQYYPFRVGDIMLPLNTCLLFTYAMEIILIGRVKQVYALICIILLSFACSIQSVQFQNQLLALPQFPTAENGIENSEWKTLCDWVRDNTSPDAIFVSPPVEFPNFTWLAERATIVKFRFIPPSKAGVISWYNRLTDLSGDINPWPLEDERVTYSKMTKSLTAAYNSLTTPQAENIAVKYKANYLITGIGHQLNLPIAYQNPLYIIYTARNLR